jgi:hypothetical protein
MEMPTQRHANPFVESVPFKTQDKAHLIETTGLLEAENQWKAVLQEPLNRLHRKGTSNKMVILRSLPERNE